jgi:dolichyl-phosphate-mannose--protein O-mannosyl transferase
MKTETLPPNPFVVLFRLDGNISDLKYRLYQFATTAMIGLICILIPIFIYSIWFIYIQMNNLNTSSQLTNINSSVITDTFTLKISAIVLLILLMTGIAIIISSLFNIRRELNRLRS